MSNEFMEVGQAHEIQYSNVIKLPIIVSCGNVGN